MNRLFALALAALTFVGTHAQAATLGGNFNVFAVNFDAGGVRADVYATFDKLVAGTNTSGAVTDFFTYSGLLDFGVGGPQRADFTVADWLSTGTGSVSGLDAGLAGQQLSFPTFTTTTMFLFEAVYDTGFDFDVRHDDGMAVFENGGPTPILAYENATGVRNTNGGVFGGGLFDLIYVAANGNPSVLNVTGANVPGVPAVPLPASALLLLGAFGMFGVAARRKA